MQRRADHESFLEHIEMEGYGAVFVSQCLRCATVQAFIVVDLHRLPFGAQKNVHN